MKKIFAVLLVGCLLFCATACSSGSADEEQSTNEIITNEDKNSTDTKFEEFKAEEPKTEEQKTEKKELSDECDKILASGYDADGSYYELVANETEDYNGTIIKIGVIKDNVWSIPMTTDCPFIGEDGLLLISSQSIYDEWHRFYYIGSGCFGLTSTEEPLLALVIWNGNNGKSYIPYNTNGEYAIVRYDSRVELVNNEGYVIVEGRSIQYLDLETMQVKTIENDVGRSSYVYPYSEGLFAVADKFYNLKGEVVIDLGQYNIENSKTTEFSSKEECLSPSLVFHNGKCTIDIVNDQGSKYQITIDKTGKVIDSVKL